MALFGRHGEAPVAVIAPQSPSDCFYAAIEAARIALTYRTPVHPALRRLRRQRLRAVAAAGRRRPARPAGRVRHRAQRRGRQTFLPYLRDPETLARPWAIPGTPGLEHRIGGLEKADKTGDISYDPANHDFMVRTRAARIEGIDGARRRGRGPGRRRPGAGARLGLDLRPDRRRLPGAAPARAADRPGAPAAPQPAAGEPRRGARGRTTRWSSRR